MFCNKCGAQLDDTAVFCRQCGNPISGGKQTGQKAMQPGARTVQRKTIYAIGALLAAVVVIGIIVAFGMRSAGKSEESDFYGTWTTLDGLATITLEEDGVCELRGDGSDEVESGSFTYNKDHTITIQLRSVDLGISCELYDKDRMLVTIDGMSVIFHRSADGGAEVQPDPGASLYGSWEAAGGTVAIDIYEDGNIRIWGLEKVLGADAFTFTETDEDTLALTANLDSEWAEMFSLNLDYVIDGNVMTVEIADYTFELEKVE